MENAAQAAYVVEISKGAIGNKDDPDDAYTVLPVWMRIIAKIVIVIVALACVVLGILGLIVTTATLNFALVFAFIVNM